MTAGPGSPGCVQGLIDLSNGPGNGWPAFIRSQLFCDAYTLAEHQVVGEIDAIKITASSGRLTLLVNPGSTEDVGPGWLPAGPAACADVTAGTAVTGGRSAG
jgi:hypothetical protein